jgi:hypothetical protein
LSLLIVSTVWKVWRDHKYEPFAEGMTYARTSTGFVPRYTATHGGDIYYVKYPDFLSFTGNLAIKPEDDSVLDSLLIWPQIGGGFKYGVIVNHDGINYQVYISQDGITALYEEYQWLVDAHQKIIQHYLAKANGMWDLAE